MSEELRERLEGELAQPLPLRAQPVLERRLLEADSLEEISPVERGGALERGCSLPGCYDNTLLFALSLL